MRITSIQIHPSGEAEGRLRATADVVLNDSLYLRGIRIMTGRYGLFLAFPGGPAKSPRLAYETVSMDLRRRLQEEILEAYHAGRAEARRVVSGRFPRVTGHPLSLFD